MNPLVAERSVGRCMESKHSLGLSPGLAAGVGSTASACGSLQCESGRKMTWLRGTGVCMPPEEVASGRSRQAGDRALWCMEAGRAGTWALGITLHSLAWDTSSMAIPRAKDLPGEKATGRGCWQVELLLENALAPQVLPAKGSRGPDPREAGYMFSPALARTSWRDRLCAKQGQGRPRARTGRALGPAALCVLSPAHLTLPLPYGDTGHKAHPGDHEHPYKVKSCYDSGCAGQLSSLTAKVFSAQLFSAKPFAAAR